MLVHLPPQSFKHNQNLVDGYQRARKIIFHDRLKWDVKVEDDREVDEFDSEYSHYLISLHEGQVIGGVRLTSSTFPNLTYEVFEKYFPGGFSLERSFNILESSRFGLVFTDNTSSSSIRSHTFDLLKGIVKFALDYGYNSIITVVDVRMERTLRLAGWPIKRITDVVQIGKTKTITGLLPVSWEIHDHLAKKSQERDV